jgi:hypothetical protein
MKASTKSTKRNGSSLILSLRIAPISIKVAAELGLLIKVPVLRMAVQWRIQLRDMRFAKASSRELRHGAYLPFQKELLNVP